MRAASWLFITRSCSAWANNCCTSAPSFAVASVSSLAWRSFATI